MITRSSGVALLGAALILQGCAQAPSRGGGDGTAQDSPAQCNALVSAAIGLALCALASNKDKAIRGAACAALGYFACSAFNDYQAAQTKSAKEVSDDYLRTNARLPDKPLVRRYTTRVQPSPTARGATVRAETDLVVVPGRDARALTIEEEWTLVDASGEKWLGPKRKRMNTAQGEAGAYKGGFEMKLAKELPQGLYEFKSAVYLNGDLVQSRSSALQVVEVEGAGIGQALAGLGGSAQR